jgi:hypothetical protein
MGNVLAACTGGGRKNLSLSGEVDITMLSLQTSCFPNRAGIGTLMVRLPGGHQASSLAPLNMIIFKYQ